MKNKNFSFPSRGNNIVQKGLYYHYKHDPSGSVENYAYEVLGVGHHTEMPHEDALDSEDGMLVVYRPLYEDAFVYKNGKMFDIRPLKMFMEEVEKDRNVKKRFTRISNEEIIRSLELQVKKMYL